MKPRKACSCLNSNFDKKGFSLLIVMTFITAAMLFSMTFASSHVAAKKELEEYVAKRRAYFIALTGLERFKPLWPQYIDYNKSGTASFSVPDVCGAACGGEVGGLDVDYLEKGSDYVLLMVTAYGAYAGQTVAVMQVLKADFYFETSKNNNKEAILYSVQILQQKQI